MLNAASFLFGFVALGIVVPGLLIGLLNWLALPIAGLGAALGAFSSSNWGRNFNFVVLGVAIVRLSLGGGVL